MIKFVLLFALVNAVSVQAGIRVAATYKNLNKSEQAKEILNSFRRFQAGVSQSSLKTTNPTLIPTNEPFFQITYANTQKPGADNVVIYFSPSCGHCYEHLKDGSFATIAQKATKGEFNVNFRILEMTPMDAYIVALCMQGGEQYFLPNMQKFLGKMYENNLWRFFQTSDKNQKMQMIESLERLVPPAQIQGLKNDLAEHFLQVIAILVGLNPYSINEAANFKIFLKNSISDAFRIDAVPILFRNGKEESFKDFLSQGIEGGLSESTPKH